MPHPTGVCRKHLIILVLSLLSLKLFSQPVIKSFSPGSGFAGSSVIISGSNFSSVPANNIVFFGSVRATVTAASPTSLTVTVPTGATFKPISVTVNRLTSFSAQSFILTFPKAATGFTQQSFEYTTHIDSVDANTETTKYSFGDIDNDGKIDIVTIDRLNNTLSVYRNTTSNGKLSFAAKVDFSTAPSPRSVEVADLDGDGNLDILVSNFGTSSVSIFKNTSTAGSISFAAKADFPTATQPAGISVTDLDLDGRPDLVINTVNLQGYISVLRNTSTNGTLSFAARTDLPAAGGSIEEVKTGDFDGDGKSDILVPNFGLNVANIFLNLSTPGNLQFAAPFNLSTFQGPDEVALGDLNNDGKPDLLFGHYISTRVPVLKNVSTKANFVFQYDGSYESGPGPTGLSISDLDGDGKPDFVVNNGLESFSIYKNTSQAGNDLTFAISVTIPGIYNTQVSSADFDGDGIPDLAFKTGIYRVTVWKNRGKNPQILSFSPNIGTTGDTITIQGVNFSGVKSVSFGGVEASSFIEVDSLTVKAVVGSGATGELVVRTATDSAYLSGFTYVGPPVISSIFPTIGGTGDTITIQGNNFSGVDTVRFGGIPASWLTVLSPNQILAVVDSGSSGSVSATNTFGTGSLPGFTFYPTPVITGFSPGSGAAGTGVTITGTDFKDVISVSFGGVPAASFTVNSPTSVTAYPASGKTGRIKIVTPGGTGISPNIYAFPKPIITSFSPLSGPPGSTLTIYGSNFMTDPESNIVFFGAVRAKVVAVTATTLNVIVPSGTTYQPISLTVNGYTVYARDQFNMTFQDGNSAITASSFEWKGGFTANNEPASVYLADFDGDGKSDIVSVHYGSDAIAVLRNTSQGGVPSFEPYGVIFGYIRSLVNLNIGDINGDGKPDIVAVNFANRIFVFRNTSTAGKISFEKTNIDLDRYPSYISMQDYDGDGKIDLAVSSSGDVTTSIGSISILPNIGTEGNIAFGAPIVIDLLGSPIDVKTADLDKDGKPDITFRIGAGIYVLRNIGSSGNFLFDQPINIFSNKAIDYSYYSIADYDGDGKTDFVACSLGYVYLLRNTTSGNNISFGPLVIYPIHPEGKKVIAGQLNGDGKPDIVVVADNKIFVYRNVSTTGTILFDDPTIYTASLTYKWTDDAAIGDIEGDGKPDIVVANGADEKISVFRSGIGETTDSVCQGSNLSIVSNLLGSNYQWQLNTANGFVDIHDDTVYTGTATNTLAIQHLLSLNNNQQYRCLVDGIFSRITNVIVPSMLISGSVSAPAEVCSDSVFNLQFTPTSAIPTGSRLELWESLDSSVFSFKDSIIYQGQPIEKALQVKSASSGNYYFKIIPAVNTSCDLSNNSDTATVVINHLTVPEIVATGPQLTVSNPDSAAAYSWQILDSTGIWNTLNPPAPKTNYLATISGSYRVVSTFGGCLQLSNEKRILIDTVANNNNDRNQLQVYPNPGVDNITVKFPVSTKVSYIRIIDLTGKIVADLSVQQNTTSTEIRVGKLFTGIYKLVWTDGQRSLVKMIMIAR